MKRSILLLISALVLNWSLNAAETYTVYWSVNGEIISEQSVEAGGFMDMTPEAPMVMACSDLGYTFVGWSDQPITGSQSWEPDVLYTDASEMPLVYGDVTYYAVFRSDVSVGGGGTMEYVTSCENSNPAGGDPTGATSGTLTGGQTWEISDGGTLYIAGGGSINGFSTPDEAPWYNYSSSITTLYLNADFFSIGDYVFYSLNSLSMIQSPSAYVPTLTSTSFNTSSIGKQITLSIRGSLKSQYESDPYWGMMNVYAFDSGGDDPVAGDQYTVNWSVNGSIVYSTEQLEGTMIVELPETPTACDAYGYTFVGWSDQQITSPQSWAPNLYTDASEMPLVNGDVTYYAVFRSETAGGGSYETVDELTLAMTGVPSSSNTYSDWSNVTVNSSAMYAGNSAGGNDAIQLRSSQNSSGIITTASAGMVTKVSVEWNSKTSTGQTLNIYGSTTPFTSVSDLYSGSATLIGTLTYDGASISEYPTGDYPYIGLRSASGALYLTSISIVWSTGGAGSSTEYVSICGGGSQSDAVSGQVTPYITWALSNGKLTISGSGAMPDYQSMYEVPWYEYASQITDATVDDGIVYIGNYTFAACSELMNVMFPRSLKSIGINIFTQSQNNHAIALNMNAFIPPSITESTFGNVAGVLYIYVWESVQTLYVNRSIWEHLMVFTNPDPSGTTIGIMNDNLVWYFGGQEIRFFGEGVIPDYEDASQQPWADFREGTRNLYVEAELTRIGTYAFSGFSNIFTMELPSTLQEIGSYAFENCTNIAEIDIKGVNQVVTVNSLSFNGVSPLSNIGLYVPESMVSAYASDPVWGQMGVGALPEDNPTGGITGTVGELTWTLMDGELIIDGIGEIPDFSDDEGLPWTPYNQQIFTIKLNGDISSIGTYAFAGLTNLNVLNASSALQYIAAYAFNNCQALTTINLPVNEVVAADGDAFNGCLTSNITLYVPEHLLSEFSGTEVWGSMNVVSSGDSGGDGKLLDSGECGPDVFWELYESGKLIIKGNSYIYGYTYYADIPWYIYRSQITTVEVQEGVQSLTKASFIDCNQLSSISLPASLCCLDDSTFYNCVALRTIVCTRENPPSVNGMYPFGDLTLSEITLYVPEGSGIYYEYADYWKQMQIEERGSSTSQLESYQLEYIFVNSIGISGFNPNIYNYDVTLPAGSGTPQLSYMRGNNSQEIEVEQPTSPNSTGYIHVSVDGVRMATYTINFICESNQVTIALTDDWRFIMLQCGSIPGDWSYEDITTSGSVTWAYYDGEKRASGQSGWTTESIIMNYYKNWGHIVRAQNGTATVTFKVKADANSSSAPLQLHQYPSALTQNANWNLTGNPYNAGYNIRGLKAAGITAPIHIWNGTGYTAYDPEYDDYTLQPFEAFFVQLPDDAPEKVYLSPEYIVGNGGNGGNTHEQVEGELSGAFSIGESMQVHFSKGNLQYNASSNIWRFAESQYDYIGEENTTNISDPTNDGWIDLFGWGTGDNPTRSTQNGSQYSEFTDWGINPILNGGNIANIWQTLKSDEWTYLLQSRANAQQLQGVATVNGYTGLILLPDNWYDTGHTALVSSYTSGEWETMENAGAVFLPAAGYRWGSTKMFEVGVSGEYWSASFGATDEAYDLDFKSGSVNPMSNYSREYGFSVRLVRQIQ